MSEESKSDYVSMGEGSGAKPGTTLTTSLGTVKLPEGLDDPSLSQEDRDMRLAIALQQQENAAAYDAHKKRHDEAVAADKARTTRSSAYTRLAQIRKKDHGKLSTPKMFSNDMGGNAYVADQSSDYANPSDSMAGVPPGEIEDRKLAAQLQKVEQASVGTADAVNKMLKEDKEIIEAQEHRTQREAFGRGFA
mmetsp:Transcript_11226/g.25181  ORF Transcript_11226/g.25181 Transcript_11226/m.25181 type:complete len:192 (+) Transcript_11226:663-1238(+)